MPDWRRAPPDVESAQTLTDLPLPEPPPPLTSPAPPAAHLLQALAEPAELFPPGATVLVAVSGGPDSVALLSALRAFASQRRLSLHLAHLDHMLRPEGVADAAWVQQLAADWQVPATVDARDVRRAAARLGRGIEETARLLRYAFLAEVAGKVGADRLALAHHREDQAETLLLSLLRGAGLDGLRGMRPLAPFPLGASQLAELGALPPKGGPAWPPPLARPFLGLARQDLAVHLQALGLQARQDASNQDPAFRRNRLRLEILPQLQAFNPELIPALSRTAQALAGDADYLDQAADQAWRELAREEPRAVLLDRPAFLALHPALQRRLLRRACSRLGEGPEGRAELGWEAVEEARRRIAAPQEGGAMTLPGALQLELDGEATVRLRRGRGGPVELPPPQAGGQALPLNLAGSTLWLGWRVEAQVRERRLGEGLRGGDPWRALLDLEALGAGLRLRGRLPGDRLQPLGMGGQHKRLQDLFVDAQVPAADRDRWPVLVTATDAVAWVPGLRLDERYRVTASTRRVLELRALPPGTKG